MKRLKTNFNKALSFTLSLALCFTALFTGLTASVSAETMTNSIINGDFSTNTLYGYDVSENVSNNEAISVNNEVCYIPERTDTTADGAYNRWINQKVTLENGKYIFAFDLDMTFSSNAAYSFAYTVKPGTAFDGDLKKPTNTNGTNYTVSSPVISAISPLNTGSASESVPVDGSKFVKSGTSGFWNYNGTANTRYVGRVSAVVDLNNTASSTTELLFSIGCYSAGVSAYVDNISVEKITLFNGDFSNGLVGYDVSPNRTHDEAMTVTDGVCYIPTVTSTIANDKPYNRWLNQKLILENGKYVFSYDLDITYTTANAWSFAHAVRNAENMDANIIRPHSSSAYTGITVGTPTVEPLDYVLNTNDATTAAPLNNFALSNTSKYYNYNGSAGRQVGRVSFIVEVNNASAETTALYFSIGNYANACSSYIDNISVEKVTILNGDFSNGLTGYDVSANRTHNEAMTVTDGVCYIPTVTSTVANDKPYNRWLNQKVVLENGKYIFSYDLDITYTSANAWSFAHAVRNAENMDANIIRPTSGAAYTGITVGTPTVESLDYVLNTNDTTTAAPLNNFALSNTSKYYNYNGSAGRQVGRVSFVVEVNNTAPATALYFSIGNYANASSAYIDNISLIEVVTIDYIPVNVKGKAISLTETEHHELNSAVSKSIGNIADYTFMGYKVGTAGEIVYSNLFETIATKDTEINCVYALKGDLNDDLYINAIDLAALKQQLLGIVISCNMAGAQVNNDDVIDIRDLIALKKKIVNASLDDGVIVNPNINKMRDPYMLLEDGVYYLYGTGGICYKNYSRSLSDNWQSLSSVVETPTEADGNYFWAPEVYKYNNSYYMFTSYHSSETGYRGCAVFRSDSPEGTFVQISNGTITPSGYDCIDGSLYIDKQNQPWMIFSVESDGNSIGRMLAAQLSSDLTSFVSEPIELFRANEASWSSGKYAEGPGMYRCENGELLMVWSGFEYVNGEYCYCVGTSRSDNGEITGNWTHDATLLYSVALSGEYDGGHGMVFESLTGQLYLSVHTPNDEEGVDSKPVFVPIKEVNGTLVWDVD